MTGDERGFVLRTLGHPVLTGPQGAVGGLRRKDLALLAYLCVEGTRPHSRARLAALLWGDSPEGKARHSLTQALGRVMRAAGSGALAVERDSVRATGAVACDAEWLLAGGGLLDELLTLYDGPFLEGFEAGFGSEDFGEWADARRAELRNAAVRWLEGTGAAAEAAGDWPLALRIGERGTQVDPVHEAAHRRVLRALHESGERNRALRHYQEFARWLDEEVGGQPDPETLALVEHIRASTAVPTPAAPPSPDASRVDEPVEAEDPAETLEPRELEKPAESIGTADPAQTTISGNAAADPDPADRPDDGPAPAAPPAGPHTPRRASRDTGSPRWAALWLLAGALTVVLVQTVAGALVGPPREPIGHGETLQAMKGGPVYLAFGETLWRYPDDATLDRCLGGWRQRIRRVRTLPDWPRRTLLSVTTHPWQGSKAAVVGDHPELPTQYVAVGCVLAPVPDPPTFRAVFGHTDWNRSDREADSLLRASPHIAQAAAYPVRASGTLIRGAGGEVKWVVYHGGALVATARLLKTYCRSPAEAVRVSDAEYAYYRAFAALPPADPQCHAAADCPPGTM